MIHGRQECDQIYKWKCMTYIEEQELLQLTRENNILLKEILKHIRRDDVGDFFTNIIANVIGNRIDGGYNHERY